MQLVTANNAFVAVSNFTEKEIVKSAGFRWHGFDCKKNCPACKIGLDRKIWWTDDVEKAAKLIEYADELTKQRLEKTAMQLNETLAASRATDIDIEIPAPAGLSYMPFQKTGIAFALKRFGFDPSKTLCYTGSWKGESNANREICEDAGGEGTGEKESSAGSSCPSKRESEGQASGACAETGMDTKGFSGDEEGFGDTRSETALSLGDGEIERTAVEFQGRQRVPAGQDSCGIIKDAMPAGVRSGIPDQDEGDSIGNETRDMLQSGLWSPGKEDRSGSGRSLASTASKKSAGRQKGSDIGTIGLAHPTDTSYIGGVLIADQMGLGKTVEALGVINCIQEIRKILIVCPASLRLNWKREAEKWLMRDFTIGIGSSSGLLDTDINIVNWDILGKLKKDLEATCFDLLIADEAHMAKNPKTIRAKALFNINARRRMYLTGTAISNRPIEIFPLINSLDAKRWPNFFGFAKRYAGAVHNGYGWDFSGSSNLDELQDKLRTTIMIRRLKADVLTELPAKRRQVIELPANGAAKFIERERILEARREEAMDDLRAKLELAKVSDNEGAYDNAVAELKNGARLAFEEIARVRHDTAVAKIPSVVEHVKDLIAEDGYKVVVFCHHHDVQDALMETLGSIAVLHRGGMNDADKQVSVDRFQNDPKVQVFVGSIMASGVGITLTKSSHVVFAELDWVPGNVTQAEDRCHRISQINSVLVQHLVLEGSVDSRMAKILIKKQAVIDAALDTPHKDRVQQAIENVGNSVTPEVESKKASSHDATREQLASEALLITPAQTEAIHAMLRILAGLDADHASSKNDIGFNRIDGKIGHDLAGRTYLSAKQAALGRRIAKKYHRQLPVELMEAAGAN